MEGRDNLDPASGPPTLLGVSPRQDSKFGKMPQLIVPTVHPICNRTSLRSAMRTSWRTSRREGIGRYRAAQVRLGWSEGDDRRTKG